MQVASIQLHSTAVSFVCADFADVHLVRITIDLRFVSLILGADVED